jgi:hypothetical protein
MEESMARAPYRQRLVVGVFIVPALLKSGPVVWVRALGLQPIQRCETEFMVSGPAVWVRALGLECLEGIDGWG